LSSKFAASEVRPSPESAAGAVPAAAETLVQVLDWHVAQNPGLDIGPPLQRATLAEAGAGDSWNVALELRDQAHEFLPRHGAERRLADHIPARGPRAVLIREATSCRMTLNGCSAVGIDSLSIEADFMSILCAGRRLPPAGSLRSHVQFRRRHLLP
jgi:hypothetical protein